MKQALFLFFIILFSASAFAQTGDSYADAGSKSKGKSSNPKWVQALQKEGEYRKTRSYREALVDASRAKYEKKFKHRKVATGTAMGDCPGNPSSKFNKRNPYKRERNRQDKEKPKKRKK